MPDLFEYLASTGEFAEHLIALATVAGAIVWAAQTFAQIRKGVAAIAGILDKLTAIEASLTSHKVEAGKIDADHKRRLDAHGKLLDEHSSLLSAHEQRLAGLSRGPQ